MPPNPEPLAEIVERLRKTLDAQHSWAPVAFVACDDLRAVLDALEWLPHEYHKKLLRERGQDAARENAARIESERLRTALERSVEYIAGRLGIDKDAFLNQLNAALATAPEEGSS